MKKICFLIFFISLLHYSGQSVYAQNIAASGNIFRVKAVLKNADGTPAPGVMTYLTVAANPYDLRTSVSDQQGNVEFLVPSLPEKSRLIFQADAAAMKKLIFQPVRPLVSQESSPSAADDGYLYYDSTIFYGTPDRVYLLDDYTRFATLEEVFREYVSEVKLNKQGENYSLAVINKPFKVFFDNEPLVLLDGVPVFDINRLMEIDPLKIRAIDVVARRYYLGKLMSYGIISLFSFDGDMAGYSLPSSALVIGNAK